jgi:hypothetical protein
MRLAKPITALATGKLTVSVQDRQSNVTHTSREPESVVEMPVPRILRRTDDPRNQVGWQ